METEKKMDQENPEADPIEEDRATKSPIKIVLGPEGFEHQQIFDDGLGELIYGGGLILLSIIMAANDSNFYISLLLILGLLLGGAFLLRPIRNELFKSSSLVGAYYSRRYRPKRNDLKIFFEVMGVFVSVLIFYQIVKRVILPIITPAGELVNPYTVYYWPIVYGFRFRKPRYFLMLFLLVFLDFLCAVYCPAGANSEYILSGGLGLGIFLIGCYMFMRFAIATKLWKGDHGI